MVQAGEPAADQACVQSLPPMWWNPVGVWLARLEGRGEVSPPASNVKVGMMAMGYRHWTGRDGKDQAWEWPVWSWPPCHAESTNVDLAQG